MFDYIFLGSPEEQLVDHSTQFNDYLCERDYDSFAEFLIHLQALESVSK
jgi:hypothetical protein